MKITIDIEIQPDEVAAATELLRTLRSLTEDVRVHTRSSGAAHPQNVASAGSASTLPFVHSPTGGPKSGLSHPNGVAMYPSVSHGTQSPPLPHASFSQQQMPPAAVALSSSSSSAAAAAAVQPGVQPTQQMAVPAPMPQASPPATAHAAAAAQLPQQVYGPTFTALIPRLADATMQEQAIADIIAVLRGVDKAHIDKAFEDLTTAYEQCVFENRDILGTTGVMPYMVLFTRLPEDELGKKIRERLVAKVLATLTKKRPIAVDRTSFFGYADAFACLVKFDAIPMDGAIQTLSRILKRPETRCAAVTMLGKTVEYCGEQLMRVPDGRLLDLWSSLKFVKEENFQYDMQYIINTTYQILAAAGAGPHIQQLMPLLATSGGGGGVPAPGGGGDAAAATPAPAPAAAPASAAATTGAPAYTTPTGITQLGMYEGHEGTVFSMCYDAVRGQLISAGQDGCVLTWGSDGTPVSRMTVSSHYICCMNVLRRSGALVAAAVPMSAPGDSCVLQFLPTSGGPGVHGWEPYGRLNSPKGGILSFVTPLGGDGDTFVFGESWENPGPPHGLVYLYDAVRGVAFEQLKPVRIYTEHTGMVTSAAGWDANPNTFLTTGRDLTIRVWDRRVEGNVGVLESVHSELISGLETTESYVITASVDASMCIWDLRQLPMTHGSSTGAIARLQFDRSPILKLALAGAPHTRLAAISSYTGIHLVDFTDMAAPVNVSFTPPPGYVARNFHDIHWAGGQPVIFAASDDSKISVFGVNF